MAENEKGLRETNEPSRFSRALGPALTLALMVITEVFHHLIPVGGSVGPALLLLALAPIAYTGLKRGFWVGIASATALAIYTLHFVAPHETLFQLDIEGWTAFVIMMILSLALVYPMSRIKAQEDRLRWALEARAHDLEVRNRELVDANEALEAFGYVVSHDLKEPVRAVENYFDAARQDWPSQESKGFVEEAYRSNARMARLLEGLLSYSRTSSLVVNPRSVDVSFVLHGDACTSQYRAKLDARGGELRVGDPLPRIMGDEVILAQLLGNIVLNAIRHNPKPAPRVSVHALPATNGRAHLVIADDGPGFPDDVIHRFETLRGTRPATIKSGFGLVIAHRAAQRLGGRIQLANTPSGGEVHLDLPAAPPGEVPPVTLAQRA